MKFKFFLCIIFLGFGYIHASSFMPKDDDARPDTSTAVPDVASGEVRELRRKPESKAEGRRTNNPGHSYEEIPFSFEKKPLVEIIEFVAQKKGYNIIFPQNPADADIIKKQEVTYRPLDTETVSLDTAWQAINTFLEMSGFSLFPKSKIIYAIVRNQPNNDIYRQTLPLYINAPVKSIPRTDQHIRYIYYLRNLKAPTAEDRENPIGAILKEILSTGATIIGDPKSNAIILADKANNIEVAVELISELDSTGFRETIEVIPLYNISVAEVIRVFNLLKQAAGEEEARKLSPFIRSDNRESVSYFAADTKFVADNRTNSLIVMGRESAINKISEFIREYMDVLPESGDSILHVYDLQYLDAAEFAKTLSDLVKPLAVGDGKQGVQEGALGAERFFTGIAIGWETTRIIDKLLPETRIATEEITLEKTSVALDQVGIAGKLRTGGNRLVIAALKEDWLRLKAIIERLDNPQPQVILEVMIVDFTDTNQKLVGGDLRNFVNWTDCAQNGFTYLSSHLSGVNNVLGLNPAANGRGLAQDLLQLIASGNNDVTNPAALPSLLAQGSLLISFNDPATPGIGGLIQVLQSILQTRILSHPYLITTNNQKATVASQELRRTRGDALPSPGGVVTIKIIDVPATIQVQMVPRLSSLDRLSLQVAVDINEFRGTSLTRIVRRVNTNANLNSGQILVIGGLTRVTETDTITETPFFSRIPLIGYFFNRTITIEDKTNLAIFISPTIIHPKLRDGLNLYTVDKIRKGRRDISEDAIFGDNRDPIVHLFFKSGEPSDEIVQDYLSHASNAPEYKEVKTKREKKREIRRPKKRPQVITPVKNKEEKTTELVA